MWVVKIGGSLLGCDDLGPWLRVLTQYGKGKLVIVPGGGVFADTVRELQQQFDFSDPYAHRMALKAMEQYGLLLMGLNQELVSGASEKELHHQIKAGKVPVWFPYDMVTQSPEIATGWDITSDSLAAWLAGRLAVQHLALVKRTDPPGKPVPVEEVSLKGVVDAAFARFMKPAISTWWLHATQHEGFGSVLRGERVPHTLITEPNEFNPGHERSG